MPDIPVRNVTVFFASPTDVMAERDRAARVVDRLQSRFREYVTISPVFFEEKVQYYTADKSFQVQIPDPSSADLVIGIFWSRLGSELPPDLFGLMPDGRPYPGGAVYELLRALESKRQRNRPDILVYRKIADTGISVTDGDRRRLMYKQLDAFEAFWRQWFVSQEGHFRAGFQTFNRPDDFEQMLEPHLRTWLSEQNLLGNEVIWRISERGSPFRGLAPYEAQHAEVFFGRDREIDLGRQRLITAATAGTGFLLIMGSSGSGKSSLARAGLVPRLTQVGDLDGVDLLRVAVMRPGEASTPQRALAAALFRTDALPELVESDFPDPERLAVSLMSEARTAVAPILRALDRAAAHLKTIKNYDRPIETRLLLVIDQLEELFSSATTEAVRLGLVQLVAALSRSGRVLVIATLRSSSYGAFARELDLIALKDAGATIDIAVPGPEVLADVVRKPAGAAGLIFDQLGDDRLDDVLLATAGGNTDALPLLGFTLQWLFQHRDAERLTFAAYDQLGGLEGAIGRAAEQAFAGLNGEVQAALPRLLRGLAEASRPGAGLALRDMPLADAPDATPAGRLADALVAARILLVKGSGRDATLRLAHEAVLRGWERARDITGREQDFFRIRADVTAAEKRWHGRRRSDLLLAPGLPLAEAQSLRATYGTELAPEVVAFVDASSSRAQARQRRGYALAVVFGLVALAAIGAGVFAWRAQELASAEAVRAERQTVVAREERDRAEEERRASLANESQAMVALSRVASEDHRPNDALKFGLSAWPRREGDDRPRLETALTNISQALSRSQFYTHRFSHASGVVTAALLFKDQSRILSWSTDNTLRLWDAATGKQIGPTMQHEGFVNGALLFKDQSRVLSWSQDKTLRLWDAATGKQIGPAMQHEDSVNGALLFNDESRILSWSRDKTLRLWDAATGKQIGPAMQHEDSVNGAFLFNDESRILSWSRDKTLRLWDTTTGKQIGSAMQHDGSVNGALLFKDESRILSWSLDDTLRLWNTATGEQLGSAMQHDSSVDGALLFKDQSRILSRSLDQTLRLWNTATGEQIGPAMHHDGPVNGALLFIDENRILSWSGDNTLRLWDAATGKQIGPPMQHEGSVFGALLFKDENRILSWSQDKTLRLWDAATGKQIGPPMQHEGSVFGALLFNDESRTLSWSQDKTLRLWDAATGKQIGPTMQHEGSVFGALLFNDESRTLSWSQDNTLRLWDAATGKQIGPTMQHEGSVFGALLFKDDSRVLSWSRDKTLRLWDAATGKQIGPAMQHEDSVNGALLFKDDSRILSWSRDKTLRLWDAATGKQIGPAMQHEDLIYGALLFKDDSRVLSWSADKTLRLWDAATGKQVGPAMQHGGWVRGAFPFNDESRILSWSQDGTLRLWDAATGKQIGPAAMQHGDAIVGALLFKDENRILSWSLDGTLRLWDAATGEQIGPPMQHEGSVFDALLFKDESRILSWSQDKTLRLWDAATGKQIGPAMQHEDLIYGTLLFKDDSRVLSWSVDKTLRLWDTTTGKQIGPAMQHDDPVNGALLFKDGNRILSWSEDKTLRLWGNRWPNGNLLELACALLPDHDLTQISKRYGVSITDPICAAGVPLAQPDWSVIVRQSDN